MTDGMFNESGLIQVKFRRSAKKQEPGGSLGSKKQRLDPRKLAKAKRRDLD